MGSLAQSPGQLEARKRATIRALPLVLTVAAAFAVYWLSSFLLEDRGATTKFGADSFFYVGLAYGEIIAREVRFHPVTVALALAWLKILGPLSPWIAPAHLLKAMFAAIGALGVGAAMWAFAAVVPRRHVLVCGLIYAASLGVWYFSSIEESKIVTAALSALYIATYLHLRDHWTRRGAALLTGILLLACLNEVVAGFLVVIPFVDTLVRRGWDWRHGWWIAVHGLAGPVALFILEVIVNGHVVARESHPEVASELSHFLYWLSSSDHSWPRLYAFVVRWVFFNIAAPTATALYEAAPKIHYGGDFEPALANYFASPLPAATAVLACAMIVASVVPRYRPESLGNAAGIPWALAAYAVLRGVFFIIYLPGEPIINSPAVSLAHLLIVIIPFAASRFPAKQTVLAAFAVLLLLDNGMFFISQ